jgi:hypothetical protein
VSIPLGTFGQFPTTRTYEIQFRGIFPASNVFVNSMPITYEPFNEFINGQDGTTNTYTYDGSTLSIVIYIRQPVSTSELLQIQVQMIDTVIDPLLIETPASFVALLARCQSAKARLDYEWGIRTVYMDDYPLLLDAAATGLRITHAPLSVKDELDRFFNQRMSGACTELSTKINNLDSNLRFILMAQLQCNLFL